MGLSGIPKPNAIEPFEYYIIPASVMAKNVVKAHQLWLKSPGAKGQPHKENKVSTVHLPPYKSFSGWDISDFANRWDLIDHKLRA